MKVYLFGWINGKTTAFARESVDGRNRLYQSQFPQESLAREGQRSELAACVADVCEQRAQARNGAHKLGTGA